MTAPEIHFQKLSILKQRFSLMDERFFFENENDRKEFFSDLRNASGFSSWMELAKRFGMTRTTFQYYQYGKVTISNKRFSSFIGVLPKDKQEYFLSKVSRKPANWGQVLGGKILYKKYPKEFEKRKQNGLKKLFELRKQEFVTNFNLEIPLTENLCEFIGAFIGDGNLNLNKKGRFNVNIVGHSKLDYNYLTKYIPSLILPIIHRKTSVYFRKNTNAMRIGFSSKFLGKLLTERFRFPAGAKTYTVQIPEEIINAEERFVFATIRGIFDTDGCVFIDKRKIYLKPYPRITLQVTSQNLANQLEIFLSKYFKVYSSKTNRKIKEPKKFNSHEIYAVEIYGLEQLEKWMKLIGFSNERHSNKVKPLFDDKLLAGFEPATSS